MGALRAVADAEEVPERQLHQDAALCGAVGCRLLAEAGVGLPGAGQAQHHRVVSLGRGEGHEERGAVADPIGVGLVAHGRAHLVGARGVPAARRGVVQDLWLSGSCYIRGSAGNLTMPFFCDYREHVACPVMLS